MPGRGLLVLLLIFLLPRGIDAQVPVSNPLASYGELERRVREALRRGEERTRDAVEREKVRPSWEVGKLIDEHILLHKERADYGKQVVGRLAKDLGTSQTELSFMLQFARAYPNYSAPNKLSWAHYRELLSINDSDQREEIARKAERKKWSQKKLRSEIKKFQKKDSTITLSTERPLIPLKGSLDTYRVVTAVAGEWQGKPVIDLGFSNYLALPEKDAKRFKEGDILHVSHGKLERVKNATEWLQPLQRVSYRAYILQITDADTLWVLIDLGFGISTKQQLRLRGLDAPEITSRDGMEAKRFVEKELKGVPRVRITSTKSDKYDRYLADVFYETKAGEQFLNNRLLETELAGRV